MKRVSITRGGAVTCRATIDLPLSATSVWGQLRDFTRYARQDFFHAEVVIEGGLPRAGAHLTLSHRYAGVKVSRVGKILVWREGVGYTFSDLSPRGPRAGFPHVFGYRIEPLGPAQCRVVITVRGLWTASFIPRWAARLWLRWVFGHVVRTVHNDLLLFQLWRQHQRI
ncbi:MAG: hypothetical protein JWP03_4973 [Phycisphaerales bacterium]|nr:hypothetical protein [Phycisphaerales bacterium]